MARGDDARTTRGRISDQLKSEIFEGTIASPEVLIVDELAKRFGVSRTPVREALLTLANEGLLEARHHVGFIVTPVSPKEIVETYSLRILLERESTKLATRNITPQGLERLSALINEPANPDGRHFHAFIARTSGWGVLAEILETLMDKTARSRALFANAQGSVEDRAEAEEHETFNHRRIYAAIAAGDEDEAAGLMELHLREARKYILKLIAEI